MNTNPTSIAYKYLTSDRRASYRPIKVDRRTKHGQTVLAEYNRLKSEIDFSEVRSKQRARRNAKPTAYTNVLQRPIVQDWKSNHGAYGFKILSDRLVHGSRNHWAKNDTDRKILAILAK